MHVVLKNLSLIFKQEMLPDRNHLDEQRRVGAAHEPKLTSPIRKEMPAKNRASSKKKASSGQTSFLKKMAGGRKKSSKARSSKTALLNKITQFRKTPIDEITGKKSAHFSKLCRQYSSAADSAANIEEGHDSVDGSMEEEEHFLVQEGASVLARVAPAQRCDTDSAAAGEGSAKQPSARKRQTEASMANNCVQSHELGPSRPQLPRDPLASPLGGQRASSRPCRRVQERGEGERGEDKRVVAVDEKPPIPLLRKKVFHSRDAPSQSCSASSSDDGTGKAQAHLTNASRPSPVVMVEEGGGSKLRVKVEKVKEEKQDDVAAAEKKRVKEKQAAALEAERAEEERQAAVDATRKAKEQLLEAAEKCKALENRAKAMAAVAEAKKKVAEELSKAVPYAAMKRSSNDLSTNRPTNQMLVCIDLTSPPPSPRNKSAPSLSSGADGGHSPDANGYLSPGHKGADSSCSSSSSPSSSSGSLQSNFEQAGAGRGMAREGAVGSRSDDAAGGASSSKLRDQPEMPQQYQYNRGEPKPQKRSKKAPSSGQEAEARPRKRVPWTDDEKAALVEGMELHEGSYCAILKDRNFTDRFLISRREDTTQNQWKLKDKWLGLKKEEKKAEDERSEKERKKKEREEEGRMLRKEMVEDWDKTERRDMAEGERQRADGSSVERDGMREEESAQEVGRLGESARDEEMEGAGEGAARGGGGAGKKRRKKNYWTKQEEGLLRDLIQQQERKLGRPFGVEAGDLIPWNGMWKSTICFQRNGRTAEDLRCKWRKMKNSGGSEEGDEEEDSTGSSGSDDDVVVVSPKGREKKRNKENERRAEQRGSRPSRAGKGSSEAFFDEVGEASAKKRLKDRN